MRNPLITAFLALFITPLQAGDLCDAACKITIDFPDDGRLHAVKDLTITFGNNGLIDTGGSSVGYVEGDTLALNAGESIDFAAGGSFDIGDAGNIAHTSMEISTTGTIDFIAVGGTETITIGELEVIGSGTLNITGKNILTNGPLTVEETLNITAGERVIIVQGISAGTLDITASESVTIDPPPTCHCGSCSEGSGNITISHGDGQPSALDTIQLCGGTIIAPTITIPLGFELPTAQPVAPGDTSSGSIGVFHLFAAMLFCRLRTFRRRLIKAQRPAPQTAPGSAPAYQ